jgi:hypothetical protein
MGQCQSPSNIPCQLHKLTRGFVWMLSWFNMCFNKTSITMHFFIDKSMNFDGALSVFNPHPKKTCLVVWVWDCI